MQGRRSSFLRKSLLGSTAALLMTLTACGGSDEPAAAGGDPASYDKALTALIPADWQGREVQAGTHNVIPWTYTDASGKVDRGVLLDIWAEIKKRTGVEITPNLVPFSGLIAGIQSSRFDLGGPVGDLPERQVDFDMVDVVTDRISILAKADSDFAPQGVADLCGRTIAVVAGGLQAEQIVAVNEKCAADGKEEAEVLTLPTSDAAVLAVESDRAEGWLGLAFVHSTMASDKPTLAAYPLGDADTVSQGVNKQAIMVVKGNGDAEFLLAAYQAMEKDGTLAKIYEKYGVGDLTPTADELQINAGTDN
jgi:polar amino acid transport system substrate-binding protein